MSAPFEQEIEFLYTYAKATLEQTGKMLPMAVLIGATGRKVIALSPLQQPPPAPSRLEP